MFRVRYRTGGQSALFSEEPPEFGVLFSAKNRRSSECSLQQKKLRRVTDGAYNKWDGEVF
jgi:hypothetical protein